MSDNGSLEKDPKRYITRRNIILINALHIALFFSCAFVFYMRLRTGLPTIQLIDITIDLSGMVTGYVLFMCCIIDAGKSGAGYKYFMYLLNVVFVGLWLDAFAWLVDGIPSLIVVNVLINTLYSMCVPICACFFWLFATAELREKSQSLQMISKLVQSGLVLAMMIRFINLFTGIYFAVDADGVYSRGPVFILSVFYAYVTMITTLGVVTKERKQLQKYQIIALYSYVLAPLIVGVITLFTYGLTITYGVIMASLLLIYCVIAVDQSREKAAADRDMETAAAIQESVLPREFPPYPEKTEFDLYASMEPAKEVGGDFYDFFLTDDKHIALVIADVSGKGVPAALVMMITKSLIKNRMLNGDSPGEALYNVNNQFMEGNHPEMFVTLWAALLDIETGKGIAVNAGHEHPVMRKAGGRYEYVRYKHSIPLVALEGMRFKEHEFQMEAGDSIFVYTDGAPEAANSEFELFGEERLLDALNRDPEAEPGDVLRNVSRAIDNFVIDAEQFDDITMLCFKYMGSDKESDADELTIDAARDNLREVMAFVDNWLEAHGCGIKEQTELDLSVEEIFINVASYAYAPDTGKVTIRLEYSDDPAAVTVSFTDEGKPYDPLEKEDPDVTLSSEDRQIGGLGIYLVKQLMDKEAYRYEDGKNHFSFTKYLDGSRG